LGHEYAEELTQLGPAAEAEKVHAEFIWQSQMIAYKHRRKVMRKLMILAASVAALAVPTAAMATPIDPADGWVWNEGSAAYQDMTTGSSTFEGNTVGRWTSQITHNGQWVKEQKGEHGRSEVVQGVLLLDGQGRLAK
jgi:hypothetical protein